MTDSKTILLVEDEEGQAELIKRIFEMNAFLKTKWDIHHVSNLKDAFKCLDNDNPPSAIIADYCLPDGEGLDLTRGAKKPEDVGIPVIILTAYGTEELAVRSLKSGAMDYVVKTTERFRELPWIVERTLREWENIVRERRIEEDLQESRQQYYELVEGVNSVILRMNAKGTITFFNRFAKELFGYTRDEIIGRDIVGTIVPETESTGRDLKEMILEIGRNPAKYKNNVNENVKKNGERLWINWTNKPVLDEEGQVVEIMCIGNDITDIREMEEDLKVKNAEMERFVYTVSHDLRSPLVTISGFTGMLKKDIESNERKDIETDLLMIGDAVEKMDHLLRDTLELSRIGRIVNPPEDVSFKEIVKDALDQISGEIGSKEKDIEISLEDSISKKDKIVHVDRMRIVEVLVNLIGNAIKYMGDQPELKIEIGYRSDENVFFVSDNGIGIPPDQHEKVFQLFYKMDKESEGSGAGLAIVKRIVEVHGGKIWIESEGKKGKGSTFYFTLPEKLREGKMRNRVNKPVILLVEDDESHVMLTKRLLNDTNAAKEVLRVADRKDALDYLFRSGNYADEKKSPRPDLILLDLRIPKIDGLRVLEKIKESEEVMDIPVVVLTTSEDENDIMRAYHNHANSYLVKPLDIDEFGEMMKETYSYWLNWNRYPR